VAAKPTEDECRQAADISAARFMQLPGVQGVGVGPLGDGGCCVVVYVLRRGGSAAAAGIPESVRLPRANGPAIDVPVRVEEQDELALE
jgi:hypothetical protein